MTTDHPVTGMAIARDIGIISPNSETKEDIARRFKISPENVTRG